MSKTLQRYENKSKSQLTPKYCFICSSCLRLCKDTKIKANHNPTVTLVSALKLSKTLQRYENKSKSQQKDNQSTLKQCCLRLCKDTKIKANHNVFDRLDRRYLLSKTLQRYENKSKSQQVVRVYHHRHRCLRLCKDTKIKANHNLFGYLHTFF